jgi:hypothetical protein
MRIVARFGQVECALGKFERLLCLALLMRRQTPISVNTGLLVGLIGDLMYVLVDPRIDFEARGG